MNYKTKELISIIDYSEKMLNYAEAGNWDEVFATEENRSHTLNELFSIPFTKQEKLENSQYIERILLLNKQLESITAKSRDDIKQQTRTIHKGRNAVGSYILNTA